MKVVIIGGGPAGMMAAISSAKCGNDVTILEKMNMLGKKLLITGKGRCNITSSIPIDEFIKNIPGNGMFLYSAFNKFDNTDILNLLKEEGVETKVERGNRVFPVSDSSKDVQMAFVKLLKKYHVKVETNSNVKEIITENGEVTKVKYEQDSVKKEINAEKIILATGGKSYPGTGSTGDGYLIAEKLGHTITKIRPSLVPLVVAPKDINICKSLQGLSLKNVQIKLKDIKNEKIIYEDFGEMLFTHLVYQDQQY